MTTNRHSSAGTGRCSVDLRSIDAAGIEVSTACRSSAPNNHLSTRPYGGMLITSSRHTCGCGCRPRIGDRVIKSSGSDIGGAVSTAPNNHFRTSPYGILPNILCCRRTCGRTCGGRGRPRIRDGIVDAAGVRTNQRTTPRPTTNTTPNDHLRSGPNRRMTLANRWRTSRRG